PINFIFNADVLQSSVKYVFVTEGVFDALAINGVSVLGNAFNQEQADVLKKSGKEIIVVPDNDEAGNHMFVLAEKHGFYVAIPEWPEKDMAEAVLKYGRLTVIKHLLEIKTRNFWKFKLQDLM